MTWTDVGPLVGYMLGAFALGWGSGYLLLVYRKVTESAT
jgi:hypothetical protein